MTCFERDSRNVRGWVDPCLPDVTGRTSLLLSLNISSGLFLDSVRGPFRCGGRRRLLGDFFEEICGEALRRREEDLGVTSATDYTRSRLVGRMRMRKEKDWMDELLLDFSRGFWATGRDAI